MGRGLRHGQLCQALGCPRIQSHAAHHGGLAAPTPRHGRGVRSHFGGSRRPRCDHRVPPRRGPPPAICARIQPAVEADHARVGGAARTCHELRKAATRMLGSHPRTAMGGTGWRDRPRICTWRSSGARLKGCRLPTGRHRGSANTSPDRGMALPPLAARSLPASCTTASIPFPSRSRSGNMRRDWRHRPTRRSLERCRARIPAPADAKVDGSIPETCRTVNRSSQPKVASPSPSRLPCSRRNPVL